MKKILFFLIFLILIASVLTAYFIIDRQLYYYGKSNFCFYRKLPFKIVPQYWGYNMGNLGFVLLDQYEITLISKGDHRYFISGRTITIREITKYGYADEKLIAEVEDTTGKKYFIKVLKNNDPHYSQDLNVNILDNINDVNLKEYRWVEINDAYFGKIEKARSYLKLLFALLFIGLIYFRNRRGIF